MYFFFFFSSRRRHTRYWRDWSSDVCSSDLRWAPDLGPTAHSRRGVVGCCDSRDRGDGNREARSLERATPPLLEGQQREAWRKVVQGGSRTARNDRKRGFRERHTTLVCPGRPAAYQARRAAFTVAARPQPDVAGRERRHLEGAGLALREERERWGSACAGDAGARGVSEGAADGAEVCQGRQRLRVGVGRHASRGRSRTARDAPG